MPATPLAASTSTVTVANAALAELGIKPISNFDETSLAARTLNTNFTNILEEVLGSYPWRFTRQRAELTRLVDPAPAPYESLYQIPAGTLNVITVYEGEQKVLFERFEDRIATFTPESSTDTVEAEISATVGPDQWPAYFRRAFILTLAGALAMPLTQDERTAAYFQSEGEKKILRAQSRDAQGRTPSRIDTKLFIRRRRAGLGV